MTKGVPYSRGYKLAVAACALLIGASLIGWVERSHAGDVILPIDDFDLNFLNVPHAWTVTKGAGIRVAVVCPSGPRESTQDFSPVERVSAVAPEAEVIPLTMSEFLTPEGGERPYNLVVLMDPFGADDGPLIAGTIQQCVARRTAVVVPAYYGPMKKEGLEEWQEVLRDISKVGAIVVGSHGSNYQLGHLSFWADTPIDIYALHSKIQGDRLFSPQMLIQLDMQEPAALVGGVAALMLSRDPTLDPISLRRHLKERCRTVHWVLTNLWHRAWPFIDESGRDHYVMVTEEIGGEVMEIVDAPTLDAAMALGLEPMVDGRWAHEVLRVSEAQEVATGKGVVVAILDHMFDEKDASLKGRLVAPGSVVEGEPVFDPELRAGHGTMMARQLLSVAPDVNIMPVRVWTLAKTGYPEYPEHYIKGIRYAVENGADVISMSLSKVPDEWYNRLDEAIEEATKAGVAVVFMHYYGPRTDVIVPHFVGYQDTQPGFEYVFTVGTGFTNPELFPNTWGLSPAAPMVAGVTAMLREVNPELRPVEMREILLTAGDLTPSGVRVLNAAQALELAVPSSSR